MQTKHVEKKKLDGNYTKMLLAILNKYWKCIVAQKIHGCNITQLKLKFATLWYSNGRFYFKSFNIRFYC